MKNKRKRRRIDATGRSAAEVSHVRLHHWLMRSEAWRSLGVGQRALLIEIYGLFDGVNNGNLFLSVREAARRLAAMIGVGGNHAR